MLAQLGVVSKIYFPRGVLPLSSVVAAGVDAVIAFALQVPSWWPPGWPCAPLLLWPLLMLLAGAVCLGVGLFLAPAVVRFRISGTRSLWPPDPVAREPRRLPNQRGAEGAPLVRAQSLRRPDGELPRHLAATAKSRPSRPLCLLSGGPWPCFGSGTLLPFPGSDAGGLRMNDKAILLEDVSKRYFLGARGGLRHLGRELLHRRPERSCGRCATSLRSRGWSLPRPGGTERRRKEHAVEADLPGYQADHRVGPGTGPARLADRGRGWVPPRADRPRERLPERRHPRHVQAGDRPPPRRHRRLRRAGTVHRHSGEALLQRHVRQAWVLRGRPYRPRDPAHRRGARGWRRQLPPTLLRAGTAADPRAPDGRCRQPPDVDGPPDLRAGDHARGRAGHLQRYRRGDRPLLREQHQPVRDATGQLRRLRDRARRPGCRRPCRAVAGS